MLQPPSWPQIYWPKVKADEGWFTLRWKPPVFSDDVDITGYELTVRGHYSGMQRTYELPKDDTEFTVGGLPIDEYSVDLRATSEYGIGASAPCGSGIDIELIPSPSVNVSQTYRGVDSTFFEVSWSPVPGASSYSVWNSEDHAPDTFDIDRCGKVSRSYSGRTVHEGTSLILAYEQVGFNFKVKVRACGFEDVFGSRRCSSGTEVTVPVNPLPAAPESLSVVDVGDNWVVLSWDPVPDATSYYCWPDLIFEDSIWYGLETQHPSCDIWNIGLEAGMSFEVKVVACREERTRVCGEAATIIASTRLLSLAPESYPVSVKEVGETWFTLAWDPPAKDSHYSLRLDDWVSLGSVRGLLQVRVWDIRAEITVPPTSTEITVPPENIRIEIAVPSLGSDTDYFPEVAGPSLDPDIVYFNKIRICRETTGTCGDWVIVPVSTRSRGP